MAKFIVNSTQTVAIRIEDVGVVTVNELKHGEEPSTYVVRVKTTAPVDFEYANTLAEAQQKAAPVIQALQL